MEEKPTRQLIEITGPKFVGLGSKRTARVAAGEWDAHGKTTTEILHVVQNDGPWGWGENSVGLGSKKSRSCGSGSGTPTERQLPRFCTSSRMTALGGGE